MNGDGKPKAAVVVVTGATGNLGAAVIARLQRDGHGQAIVLGGA